MVAINFILPLTQSIVWSRGRCHGSDEPPAGLASRGSYPSVLVCKYGVRLGVGCSDECKPSFSVISRGWNGFIVYVGG